jgi:hypothetical protein
MNPGFSYERSLVDAFWVGSDSFFTFNFGVNMDFVRWRIHVSSLDALSLMVSDLAATQLSMTISEST